MCLCGMASVSFAKLWESWLYDFLRNRNGEGHASDRTQENAVRFIVYQLCFHFGQVCRKWSCGQGMLLDLSNACSEVQALHQSKQFFVIEKVVWELKKYHIGHFDPSLRMVRGHRIVENIILTRTSCIFPCTRAGVPQQDQESTSSCQQTTGPFPTMLHMYRATCRLSYAHHRRWRISFNR